MTLHYRDKTEVKIGDRVRQDAWDAGYGAVRARVGSRGTVVGLGRTRAVVRFDMWSATYRVGISCLTKIEEAS